LSIHGIRLPASGTPKFSVGYASLRMASATTVDVEDRAGRVGQLIGDRSVGRAHLLDQFTHVLRAGTGGRLIGHGAHPLDQAGFEQTAQAHQHQADGAVAADVVLGARVQLLVDDLAVDRVEDDDRVILHAQAGSGVDPVTLPAGFAQLREDFAGVVAALAGQITSRVFSSSML
jgi:hypothetical protein